MYAPLDTIAIYFLNVLKKFLLIPVCAKNKKWGRRDVLGGKPL